MATDIEIANSALAKIKGRFINTFDDATTEARLIKRLFAPMRDRLLREIAPNFAKKRYELAQLVETPVYGFDYVYAVPSDVIKVLETDRYHDEDWKYENNKIYANDTTFFIECIYKVVDCEKFDSVFAEALAYSLAAELAIPLTNSASIAERIEAKAERLVQRARSYSSQERGSIVQPEATDWLLSRY